MYYQYRTSTILALALANSVSALLSRPTWRVSANVAATEPAVEPKVFPKPAYDGLILPYGTGATKEFASQKVQAESMGFLAGLGGGSPAVHKLFGRALPNGVFLQEVVGKSKSDPSSLDAIQKFTRAELEKQNAAAVPGLAPMPDDYNFFGGDDLAAQLCVILESNPFYASSLTPRAGGGFEIINFVCHAARARTPDSQTPDRFATHTFEPCLG